MLSPHGVTGLAPTSATGATRVPAFKVALIDPSLFTLPYDMKLAAGLREIGHSVTFYGKALGPEEAAPAGAVFRRSARASIFQARSAAGN